MVFPAFLFSVGMALGLSSERIMAEPAARAHVRRRVARRAATLVLGLALEFTYSLAIAAGAHFPGKAGLGNLRIPGILQRIGAPEMNTAKRALAGSPRITVFEAPSSRPAI